jgi:hypothetical protein
VTLKDRGSLKDLQSIYKFLYLLRDLEIKSSYVPAIEVWTEYASVLITSDAW